MAHVANVTVNSSQVSADHTDFVVYVDLSGLPTTEFWGTVANGGGDIRCYKSDGTTELAREVVSCDTATDTGELHVKYTGTLSSSVDTEIQIWTDEGTEPAVTATYGRNAVWGDYEIVWHGESLLTDSTGNHTFESVGSPSLSSGVIGSGADGFSSSDYIRTTDGIGTFSAPFTMQGWGATSTPGARVIAIGDSSSPAFSGQAHISNATSLFQFDYRDNEANDSGSFGAGFYLFHAVEAASHASRELFVDGVTAASNATASSAGTFDRLTIGASADSTTFGGVTDLDELRYRYSALSSQWIADEYTNQNTPATFYTVSAVGGGGDTYTLSLDTGSLALTGGTLNTQVSRQLSLSGGSYSTTGGDLSLLANRALALNVGGFALTGGGLNLLSARKLDIASGTYSLTGGDVNFVYTPNAGAFDLTLEQGTFTLTGQALNLLNSRLLSIDAGSFGVSGGNLDNVNGYVLDLASGTFLLTGQTLDFSYDRAITLQQGDIIVTGGVLDIRPSNDISSTLVMPNQLGLEQVSLVDLTAGELGLNLTTGKMWTVDQSFNLVTVGGLYNGQDLPRSDPQTLGAFWNDNGILKVSAG